MATARQENPLLILRSFMNAACSSVMFENFRTFNNSVPFPYKWEVIR